MTKIDEALYLIGNYVKNFEIMSPLSFKTAKLCLQDAIGCAILSLKFPECKKLLGPLTSNTKVLNGARVLGTDFVLEPCLAAFNMGSMIRWLDFNDTFLGKEWGHPSDNLGAILSIGDYLSQNGQIITMKDVLTAMIKAYEIQGQIAIANSFNEIGLDHVILVKVASAAVTAKMLGGNLNQIIDAVSECFIDLGPLRAYRHFPNTGSRKSWAAGDQTARGLFFALLTMREEPGYKQALSAKKWGLYDTLFSGKSFTFKMPFGSYVMENILFKVSYPAEFHAQTAVEAAIQLHLLIKNDLENIASIEIQTQEPAIRIISKEGILNNHADRDHCLQYMVAVALLKGDLKETDYTDEAAHDKRIDNLRNKMKVIENKEFTKNYYDLGKRGIGNSIKIILKDGKVLGPISVEYPLGHVFRRDESLPALKAKFRRNLSSKYSKDKIQAIENIFENDEVFNRMSVADFISFFC